MAFFGSGMSLVEAGANFPSLAAGISWLQFHVATSKFDIILPYSNSGGEDRWLSTGVAFSTSRAIWSSDRGPTFFQVCFTVLTWRLLKPFKLRVMSA